MATTQGVTFFEINAMVRLGQRTELESFLRQFAADVGSKGEDELVAAKSRAIFVLTALIQSLMELGADESVEQLIATQSGRFIECKTSQELADVVAACFSQMLTCSPPSSNRYARQIVDQAIQMMRLEYAGPINDELIADRLHLSRSHFRYLFKAVTSMPFNRYLTELRLVEARKLLESSLLSVKEVCRSVGYSEVSGFCRAYRAYHGIAPSHHKKPVAEQS